MADTEVIRRSADSGSVSWNPAWRPDDGQHNEATAQGHFVTNFEQQPTPGTAETAQPVSVSVAETEGGRDISETVRGPELFSHDIAASDKDEVPDSGDSPKAIPTSASQQAGTGEPVTGAKRVEDTAIGDSGLDSVPTTSHPVDEPSDPFSWPSEEPVALDLGFGGKRGSVTQDETSGVPEDASTTDALAESQINWGDSMGDDGKTGEADDFFSQVGPQTKPIYNPPESETRFEEGVPLLSEERPETQSTNPATADIPVENLFGPDDDEESGFFSAIQQSSNEAQPPVVARKDTLQVIGTHDTVTDSPVADPPSSTSQATGSRTLATTGNSLPDADAEDDLAARWQAALDDDDELLLEDDISQSLDAVPDEVPRASETVNAPGLASPFETPQSSSRSQSQYNAYTPHQPSTSDLVQGLPIASAVTARAAAAPPYFQMQPQPQQPPTGDRAESFVDKREGYKSPYDLPVDLARHRRPVTAHKPVSVVTQPIGVPPAPPRSSSMPLPPPPVANAAMPLSTFTASSGVPSPAAKAAPPAPKNFFEELPLPSRPRPGSSGRYAPQQNTFAPSGPQIAPSAVPTTSVDGPASQPPLSQPPQLYTESDGQSQLPQPVRVGPYASHLAPSAPPVPSVASRYSPKPPGLQPGANPSVPQRYSPAPPPVPAPPARNRYSPLPATPGAQATLLPFQPRTSSPLGRPGQIAADNQPEGKPESVRAATLPQPGRSLLRQSIDRGSTLTQHNVSNDSVPRDLHTPPPPLDDSSDQRASPSRNPYAPVGRQTPPKNAYAAEEYISDFSRRVAPTAPLNLSLPSPQSQYVAPGAGPIPAVAPRRAQSQSPGLQMTGPRALPTTAIGPHQRPASVHGPSSPIKHALYAAPQASFHSRVASQPLEFIPPADGQQLDPYERWKGAPIIKFGFGGTVLSCFPKHIPRYSAGQVAPMIKPSPGEIRTNPISSLLPTSESIVRHPGPLKAKSKKKDLLAWLSSKIAALENEDHPQSDRTDPDSSKRSEEKVLLWKVVRLVVEHDGVVEGSVAFQKAVRSVIHPQLQASDAEPILSEGYPSNSPLKPFNASSQPDATDPRSLETIRNGLLEGNREKAVWHAVDNRLWGHAMLIASTLDRSIWKQLVQEFVRREVQSAEGSTESLAALYEIFAGNIEESIDELVPPSARAGLHMVSKVNGLGPTKDALAGLDSWRDTLGLVLSNRTPDDGQALVALGQLLSMYGRTEAAHICYIFSRAPVFGGVDDPQAAIVLLGADHRRSPSALWDEDMFLLTEAYEYATTVLAGSATASMPHFLSFKLLHAQFLAERGRNAEAQQYCDVVAAALKATTKPSGYFHQHLFSAVDELSARLKQTPSDGSSSWISRPSMEKVSGSVWAKFNSFVAGEDSDAASTGSGRAGDGDFGPFAKVTGTPTISRSPSVSDLYGSYPGTAPQPIPAGGASSRYHPAAQYAPNASPDQPRGRSSLDSQRPPSFGPALGQRRGSQEPATPVESNAYPMSAIYGSPQPVGYHSTPQQSSYIPLAPVEEDLSPQDGPASTAQLPSMSASYYQPAAASERPADASGHASEECEANINGYGYAPPSNANTYEPPAYDNESSSSSDDAKEDAAPEPVKTKKSFMDDDDDDLIARAAALKKAEKERNDRAADEAFRRAAEEDSKRTQSATAKKGWFGGWFGGKKDAENTSGGPIRAKLGESNSFYYDKELGKWVNKKDPSSATPTLSTPPPPRSSGPPSRAASAASAPPLANGPPSLPSAANSRPSSSAAGLPGLAANTPAPHGLPNPAANGPPRSVSGGAPPATPPASADGAPAPRPASSLSQATSIDDLLGAPQARKGAAAKGKKKGRYVDVMAK